MGILAYMELSYHDIDVLNQSAWENRRTNVKDSFKIVVKLIPIVEELHYPKGEADLYRTLGYCNWIFSDYSDSLDNSIRALELYQLLGDKKGEADTLNSIGAVHMFQNDNDKRLEVNIKCLELRKEIQDAVGVSSSLNNLGETYYEMGNMSEAESSFLSCLDQEVSNLSIQAWATFNLGKLYHSTGDVSSAIECLERAGRLTKEAGDNVVGSFVLMEAASVAMVQEDNEKAEMHLLEAKSLAENVGAKTEVRDVLKLLSELFEKKGDADKALIYHKAYHNAYSDLFNSEQAKKINDIGYQFEIKQANREAQLVREKNEALKEALGQIEYQNQKLIDSIKYAERTQKALLGDFKGVSNWLSDHFVLYMPKDIVSGDFYWVHEDGDLFYVAVADCTGHGVPGALLTILGNAYLNEIITVSPCLLPGEVLDHLREKITNILTKKSSVQDGMDISMVCYNKQTKEVQWSGAMNPVFIYRHDSEEIEALKGQRQSICYTDDPVPFKTHSFHLNKEDALYLFTDGVVDQFGGGVGKKLKQSGLRKILEPIANKSMLEQRSLLKTQFSEWKGDFEQVDDVCVVGIRF